MVAGLYGKLMRLQDQAYAVNADIQQQQNKEKALDNDIKAYFGVEGKEAEVDSLKSEKMQVENKIKVSNEELKDLEAQLEVEKQKEKQAEEDIKKYGFACETDEQRAQAEDDLKEYGKAFGDDAYAREEAAVKKAIKEAMKDKIFEA